jgi:uncharacterized protein YecE (DUF72 family)
LQSKNHIGTSGWSYRHWKSCFYTDVAQNNWLAHYASQFNSVEINASFYRLQSPETLHKWREQTPDDFRFSIKANRYLTHTKRLINPVDSVLIEKQHAQHLQPKLACVLWQLPKNLTKDISKLQHFMGALSHWQVVNHVIEFRHRSWFDDETANILTAHNTAVCVSDAADWPMWLKVTNNCIYIRLHGHTQTYASRYTTTQLKEWVKRIKNLMRQHSIQQKNVWIYFDNDAECAAVHNAIELQKLTSKLSDISS